VARNRCLLQQIEFCDYETGSHNILPFPYVNTVICPCLVLKGMQLDSRKITSKESGYISQYSDCLYAEWLEFIQGRWLFFSLRI